jgi:hypothetical protein
MALSVKDKQMNSLLHDMAQAWTILAYNMKRVMRILGVGELMAAMRA